MALCPKCGVEVETGTSCPLCRSTLVASGVAGDPAAPASTEVCPDPATQFGKHNTDFSISGLSAQEVRGRQVVATEVISVCMGIIAVSVSIINLILRRRLDWSLYILLSLAFAWVMVCVPIFFYRMPWLMWPPLVVAPYLFLGSLDLLHPPLSWSIRIAAPILAAIEVACGGVILATLRSKRHGLNVVAFALLGATLVCLAIEGVLCLASGQPCVLVWSSIVAFTTVPVAGFLVYFHHRIARTTTLRKLFHL